MTSKFDEVVWAICAQAGGHHDPARPEQYPPICGRCPSTEKGGDTRGCRVVAELGARAAIKALMHPTPEMSEAAFRIDPEGHSQRTLIEIGYRAMLAAALGD